MFLQKELFSHCAAFFWDVLYVQSRHNALCTWCPSYDKRRLNFLPLTLSPIQPKNCPENNWEISSKLQVSLLRLVQYQVIKLTINEKQVNWKLKTFSFLGVSNLGFPNSGSKLIFTLFKQTWNFTNPKTAISGLL